MLLAILVLTGSAILSAILGTTTGPMATGNGSIGAVPLTLSSRDPTILALAVAELLQVLIGTVLGSWSLIQGIVAVATKRGREFGIVAIVFAVVAPVASIAISFATYVATLR
jgi:hypothetical protein